jgi:hypothetical protein
LETYDNRQSCRTGAEDRLSSLRQLDTSNISDGLPTRDTKMPTVVDDEPVQKAPSGAYDLRDKYKEQILKKLDTKAIA